MKLGNTLAAMKELVGERLEKEFSERMVCTECGHHYIRKGGYCPNCGAAYKSIRVYGNLFEAHAIADGLVQKGYTAIAVHAHRDRYYIVVLNNSDFMKYLKNPWYYSDAKLKELGIDGLTAEKHDELDSAYEVKVIIKRTNTGEEIKKFLSNLPDSETKQHRDKAAEDKKHGISRRIVEIVRFYTPDDAEEEQDEDNLLEKIDEENDKQYPDIFSNFA